MGSRFIVFLLALVAVIAIVTGIFLHRKQEQAGSPQAQSEQKPGETPAGAKVPDISAEAPQSKPTEVPSFDVVRIEPSGEGVIAGHAAPGWSVRLESGGNALAETKADEEGAWTIILEKPLAVGDQALTLKAMSPDGTRGVTSQTPVRVAVGSSPEAQPEPVVPDETVKPEPPHRAPPVRIDHVEYQDTGPDTGKISMSGRGDANERVFFFFDDAPLAEVTIGADGTWTIDIAKKLPAGEHTVRADTYDTKTRMASGRASVTLGREAESAAQNEGAAPPAGGEAPAAGAATPGSAAETYDLSSQPQPAYPEGGAEASSSEAPASGVAGEPVDLSSQPQPVMPEGGAEAPSSVAAAEGGNLSAQPQPVTTSDAAPAANGSAPQPYDLSTQPQPVVPESMTETPATTVAGQPADVSSQPQPVVPDALPPTIPAPKVAPIEFKSVDYRDKDASGTVSLAGTGEPGGRILLFFDEDPLGEVIVGGDGAWKFEVQKKIEIGGHNFRADHMEEKTGSVLGRATIGIIRMEPAKEEAKAGESGAQAAAEEAKPDAQESAEAAKPEAATPAPAPQVAAADDAKPAAVSGGQAQRKRHRPRVYTVRRGDTLWEIAEAYYGGGWHYRAILKDNRRKISNPRLIYPKQKFHIPTR